MARKKIILFIILTIIVLLAIFLPGYTRLQDVARENRKLEEEISRMEETVNTLMQEKERLESDITYIEKIAREKMGLVKEGERVIKIK